MKRIICLFLCLLAVSQAANSYSVIGSFLPLERKFLELDLEAYEAVMSDVLEVFIPIADFVFGIEKGIFMNSGFSNEQFATIQGISGSAFGIPITVAFFAVLANFLVVWIWYQMALFTNNVFFFWLSVPYALALNNDSLAYQDTYILLLGSLLTGTFWIFHSLESVAMPLSELLLIYGTAAY